MKMITFKEPDHIFGMAVINLFIPYVDDEKFQKKIENWKKTIVVDLIDIYPFSIIFYNGEISVEYGAREEYDLKLIISFDTFIGIAEGYTGLIPAFLRRKIKVKKIFHIFTVLRFISILLPALKKATSQTLPEGFYKIF